MYVLKNLEPFEVFKYFEEITRIPRSSGNEKYVADYLVNFAETRNLWAYKDRLNNVIIKKDATHGYDNSKGVILQGHIDMVAEKNTDTLHDFEKDPISIYIDGDYIKAKGTTLGADNGIALAMCLALLDSDEYKHPNIEAVFTSEEETGMFGAAALDCNLLKNKILINIDSEEEGIFLTSCAGGVRQSIELKLEYDKVLDNCDTYKIKIRGLCGGHSGADILKELANSNKLMGRILSKAFLEYNILLAFIEGGSKDNAIPRECDATIVINQKYSSNLENFINEMSKTFKNEYKINEPNLSIFLEKVNNVERCFTKNITKKIIGIIMLVPNGVQSMSLDIVGLPESSSNLGVIKITEDTIKFTAATRSSLFSKKDFIVNQFRELSNLVGGNHKMNGDYPAWEYKSQSFIRDVFIKTYRDMYNKDPEINAIHAGLECGLFFEKIPNVDIISFGPDIKGAHTPDERLSISSTKRVWEFFIRVLEKLN